MIALRALYVFAGLLLIWQAVIWVFDPPHFMLPAPLAVFEALRERPELWRVHAVTTLTETVIGLVAGTILGAGLALFMSFLPPTKRFLLPVMVVSQALPVFAIAPLLALWFGFGLASKIVMATIAIFFPVASAYHDGLARTDPQLLDLVAPLRREPPARGGGAPHPVGAALADHRRPPRRGLRADRRADRRVGRRLLRPRLRDAAGQGRGRRPRWSSPASSCSRRCRSCCAPPSISSPATSPPGRPNRPDTSPT